MADNQPREAEKNLSQDVSNVANSTRKGAKDAKSTAKTASKLATGNLAGAAKEFLKNPTGVLKGFAIGTLSIILVFALIINTLITGIMGFLYKKDVYDSASDYSYEQTEFQNKCLAKAYSSLTDEIYKDVVKKIKKSNIEYSDTKVKEKLNKNKNEIFKNEKSLENVINSGYINYANPNSVGVKGKYESYLNCLSGDENYFAILEGPKNGNSPIYDRTSTELQTLWDRKLVVVDFNNEDLKGKLNKSNADINEIKNYYKSYNPKAMYNFVYKNAKFYGNSENMSMYKSLFEAFLDGTMYYANTERLNNATVSYNGKSFPLIDTKDSNGKVIEKGACSEFNSLFKKALKEYKAAKSKADKINNNKNLPEEEKKNQSSFAYSSTNEILKEVEDLATKIKETYLGEGEKWSEFGQYYKYYQDDKYYEEISTVFKTVDKFFKDMNKKLGSNTYKTNFATSIQIDGVNNILDGDGTDSFASKEELAAASKKENKDDQNEENSDSISDIEVGQYLDSDVDKEKINTSVEEFKDEEFKKFYTNENFYKNMFNFTVDVADTTNEIPNGSYKLKSVTDTDKNGKKTDIIKAEPITGIVASKTITIDVEACSSEELYNLYLQYFYDVFFKVNPTFTNSGFFKLDKDSNISLEDYTKIVNLFLSGESSNDKSYNKVKNFINISGSTVDSSNECKQVSNEIKYSSFKISNDLEKNYDNAKNKTTSISKVSDYYKFKTPITTENSGKGCYSLTSPLNQTITFSKEFSDNFVKMYNESSKSNKIAISAAAVVGSYEYKDNNKDKNTWFYTTGAETNSLIGVKGTLTINNGTKIEIKEPIKLNNLFGNALLSFKLKDTPLNSINSLTVEFAPIGSNIQIRNIVYEIGSVSNCGLTLSTTDHVKNVYLNSGETTASVLTEAGYVVSNIYIQYKVAMFTNLFKSAKVEDTKRQFITDVSNVARDESSGKLLIRGTKENIDKGIPFIAGQSSGFFNNSTGIGPERTYFSFYVSCKPESLIYMPDGMELTDETGKRLSSDTLNNLLASITDDRSAWSKFWNGNGDYILRKSEFDGKDSTSHQKTNENPATVAKENGYQYCEVENDEEENQKFTSTYFFKDNLIKIMVSNVQNVVLTQEGEAHTPTTSEYENTTYGNWRTTDAWQNKGAEDIYSYLYNKKEEGKKSTDNNENYVPTIASKPLILGSTSQPGSGFLKDYHTADDYNESDPETYPTFLVSVSYIASVNDKTDNATNDDVDVQLQQLQEANLYDVFDLNENGNNSYTDPGSGYCWPLEDSYQTDCLIKANFSGKIERYDQSKKTLTVSVPASNINGYKTGDVSYIRIKDVSLGDIDVGNEFADGDVIAVNDEHYSYVSAAPLDKNENTLNINSWSQEVFKYLELTAKISPNVNEVIESSEQDTRGVSNALAMFDGKVTECSADSITIYNEEDEIYCRYDGLSVNGNFTAYFNDVNNPKGFDSTYFVNKGEILGSVAYNEGSETENDNGAQSEKSKYYGDDAFTVSVYSSSNFRRAPSINKSDRKTVTNTYGPLYVKDFSDNVLTCVSMDTISSKNADGKFVSEPKVEYKFTNVKPSKRVNELLNKPEGERKKALINNGEKIGTIISSSSAYVDAVYASEICYYQSLTDFFPGVNDFAKKTRKLVIKVEDVEGSNTDEDDEDPDEEDVAFDEIAEDLISSTVEDSFPVYNGTGGITLSASSIPSIDTKTEKVTWEPQIDEGQEIPFTITPLENGTKVKITAKQIGGEWKNARIKIVVSIKNKKDNTDAPGQKKTLEAFIVDKPGAMQIVPNKNAFSLNDNEINQDIPGNFTNKDGENLLVISPKMLKAKEKGKYAYVTKSDSNFIFNSNLFKVKFLNEIKGQQNVEWTLTPHNISNNILSEYNEKSDNKNAYNTKFKNTGRLKWNGEVMTGDNQYYTLTARYYLTSDEQEKLNKDENFIEASINIHIANSVSSLEFQNPKEKNVTVIKKAPKDIKKNVVMSENELNGYIKWNLIKGNSNIYGPKIRYNQLDMVNIDITGRNKKGKQMVSRLSYSKGNIKLGLQKGETISDMLGSVFDVTVSLNEQQIAYRTRNCDGNSSISFSIKFAYDIETFIPSNIPDENQLSVSLMRISKKDAKVGVYNVFTFEGQKTKINLSPRDSDGEVVSGIDSGSLSINYVSSGKPNGRWGNADNKDKVLAKEPTIEYYNDKTILSLSSKTLSDEKPKGPVCFSVMYDDQSSVVFNVYVLPNPKLSLFKVFMNQKNKFDGMTYTSKDITIPNNDKEYKFSLFRFSGQGIIDEYNTKINSKNNEYNLSLKTDINTIVSKNQDTNLSTGDSMAHKMYLGITSRKATTSPDDVVNYPNSGDTVYKISDLRVKSFNYSKGCTGTIKVEKAAGKNEKFVDVKNGLSVKIQEVQEENNNINYFKLLLPTDLYDSVSKGKSASVTFTAQLQLFNILGLDNCSRCEDLLNNRNYTTYNANANRKVSVDFKINISK